VKVVIADDNPLHRRLLERLLEQWGYQVLSVESGAAALEMLEPDSGPSLAILDWLMPNMDGLEVARRVRALRQYRYVYILLLTALDARSDLIQAFEAGVDDFLSKPFNAEELSLRLRAARRVLAAEERYRLITETASDGIITIDRDGRIRFANPAAGRILGYSCRELAGSSIDAFIPGFSDRLSRKGAAQGSELFAIRRNGEQTWLEASFSGFPALNGEGVVTAVIRDITERKVLEFQLAQAQKLESVGRLAAGVAHEINTPIQYVSDNIEFLRGAFRNLSQLLRLYDELHADARNGDIRPDLVRRISEAAEGMDLGYIAGEIPSAVDQSAEGAGRVAQIVRAMREFAHPGGVERTAVDLNRAIRSTVLVARNEWKYVAEMTERLDPQLPLVKVVPGEFNQVMLNLIVNAAQAIAEAIKNKPGTKGRIIIETRHDGGWVEIRVQDTGTGIPEELRSRIFDPFFTTKPVGKGTGQGLEIAYSIIVKRHGGTITFDSKMGEGTTFVLRLPTQEQ
jgi:two-component system, NtrC family, sensor kinase